MKIKISSNTCQECGKTGDTRTVHFQFFKSEFSLCKKCLEDLEVKIIEELR